MLLTIITCIRVLYPFIINQFFIVPASLLLIQLQAIKNMCEEWCCKRLFTYGCRRRYLLNKHSVNKYSKWSFFSCSSISQTENYIYVSTKIILTLIWARKEKHCSASTVAEFYRANIARTWLRPATSTFILCAAMYIFKNVLKPIYNWRFTCGYYLLSRLINVCTELVWKLNLKQLNKISIVSYYECLLVTWIKLKRKFLVSC